MTTEETAPALSAEGYRAPGSIRLLASAMGLALLLSAVSSRGAEIGDDASRVFARAVSARSRGDGGSAIALLRKAIELDPTEMKYRLALAETLVQARRWPEAENVYREMQKRYPDLRVVKLGLARVLLWQLKYRDSRHVFVELLRDDPADREAREGVALADYWSGDFRRAAREFRAILANTPGNAAARRGISEIEAGSRSRFEISSEYVSDDQPYRLFRGQAKASFFSDPLTRWDVSAGSYALDSSGGRSVGAPFAWLGAAISLPASALKIDARVGIQRFGDGSTSGVGGVSLGRAFENGRSTLVIEADRHELLWTASSVHGRASVTTYGVRWTRETPTSFSASAGAQALRYFDRNDGLSSDAWFLAPVACQRDVCVRVGASVGYRDTDQDRFRFVSASSRRLPAGGFEYAYVGRYDPYWTPHDLLEGRLVAAARVGRDGGVVLDLHADAGYARDRAIALGPDAGATATPPVSSPSFFRRTFHPWRTAADLGVPLAGATRLWIRYERRVTAFYRANDFQASLVGRF